MAYGERATLPRIVQIAPMETLDSTGPQASDEVLSWVGCGITKKAFMGVLAQAWTERSGVRIELSGGGATRGIRDVAAGRADLGGSCRHKIIDKAERNCDFHPVGWDALAVIVHPSNPLRAISLDALRRVFSGRLSDWSELGGNNGRIEVHLREGKISGVGLMGRELLFARPGMEYRGDALIFPSSGPLELAVEENPNALALTGISSARKRKVAVLSVDGLRPDYENLVSGRYPLVRPLYLVTAPHPRPAVRAFLRFVQSEAGQQLIRREGSVPLAEGRELWEIYRTRVARAGGLGR